MELNCQTAEAELTWAEKQNPGAWAEHSRFVALACKNIAAQCKDLSSDRAYYFGLLHDIGRYAGVTSERHLIDGYRFCMEKGWNKAAQICISHAFMIQDIKTSIGTFDVSEDDYLFMERFISHAVYDDYDRLVQLCDALALPTGFCLLEKDLLMLQSVTERLPLPFHAGKRSWKSRNCLTERSMAQFTIFCREWWKTASGFQGFSAGRHCNFCLSQLHKYR